MKLSLHRLPGTYSVHRLAPGSPLPAGLTEERFYAVLGSAEELSVCCRSDFPLTSQRREDGWACLGVDGPLDFALTGIVASITEPLARDGIAVFVISSFDTDHVLIKHEQLQRTADVLERAGIELRSD